VEEQNVGAYPVASYDPTGVAFAVAWSEMAGDKLYARICLFSAEKCEEGPFKDWKPKYSTIKIIKFSNCGNLLLIATTDKMIVLLDAYKGVEKYKLTSFLNESSIIECSFTPDTKYIVSGSEDGVIHVWSIDGQ
jgi:COMPASS component SWD2